MRKARRTVHPTTASQTPRRLLLVAAALGCLAWGLSRRLDETAPPDDVNAATRAPQRSVDGAHHHGGTTAGVSSKTPARLRFEEDALTALREFAKRPAKRVPLDVQAGQRTRAAMRALVSRMMDLDGAEQRKSARFQRTSYTQLALDVPMYLDDRARAGVFSAREPAADAQPVKTLYRESDSGDEMRFQKLLKQDFSPHGDGMEQETAATKVKDFMRDNGLVEEGAADRVARSELRQRRSNEESSPTDVRDYVLQQDTVLRRSYEGKEVVNSSATVGTLPGKDEIVLVKVANWTAVSGAQADTLKPAMDDAQADDFTQQLKAKALQSVAAHSGGLPQDARVTDVDEAWFQSEQHGLMPVLVLRVDMEHGEGSGERHSSTVLVNPFGEDELFWQEGRVARGEQMPQPATAPSDATEEGT